MKLVDSNLGIHIEIVENVSNVLVIEHPNAYRKFIETLRYQLAGGEGTLVLSSGNEILPIQKHVELIVDPFSLDLNSRKIQGKLFQLIKTSIDEQLVLESSALNSAIQNFLEKALNSQPYSIDYDLNMDLQSLLKMYHVGFKNENLNFLEILIEYIRIQSQLMGHQILIFVNLKNFISENELKQLYEFAFYSKINLILLESTYKKGHSESVVIIDSDRCVIEF